MNWRTRDKVIAAICKGETLYIKNTGIGVSVEYFGTDLREDTWRSRKQKRQDNLCQVEFIAMPNKKALNLCKKYHIKRNSHSKIMELEAEIDISNLSLTPFEGKGAKLLYEKTKKGK